MIARHTQVGPRRGRELMRDLLLVAAVVAAAGCAVPVAAPKVWSAAPAPPGSIHLALGVPTDADPSDDVMLDHEVFVVSYNPARHGPNWVAWRLVADDMGPVKRRNSFHPDLLLADQVTAVRHDDYTGSHYDRGHLCPSADRTSTRAANNETFVMTNMYPQVAALNRGPWEGLEEYTRKLANQGRALFIVSGGLFDAVATTIGRGVSVPRSTFKILVVLERGQGAPDVTPATTTYAVVMPNDVKVAGTRWPQYLVSIDEIERRSGYDFLSRVPEAIQRVLEAAPAAPPP